MQQKYHGVAVRAVVGVLEDVLGPPEGIGSAHAMRLLGTVLPLDPRGRVAREKPSGYCRRLGTFEVILCVQKSCYVSSWTGTSLRMRKTSTPGSEILWCTT